MFATFKFLHSTFSQFSFCNIDNVTFWVWSIDIFRSAVVASRSFAGAIIYFYKLARCVVFVGWLAGIVQLLLCATGPFHANWHDFPALKFSASIFPPTIHTQLTLQRHGQHRRFAETMQQS